MTAPATAPRTLTAAAPPGSEATRAEDVVTLALGCWLIGGLFLDGYAHAYIIDLETENFFTPWHAVFYAGFASLVGWVALLAYRRRGPGPVLGWFPAAYRPALVGLGIFSVGAVGDGIWHTVFGVEVGIDALLSPTHLLLLAGGLIALWTPIRSAEARGDTSPLLPVGTVVLITAVLLFFLQFLWFLPYPAYAETPFDARTGQGVWEVQQFFGGTISAIGVLVGPLLMIARRWELRFGTATVVWSTAALLEAAAFSQRFLTVVLVAIGGLVFDTVLLVARRTGLRRHALAAAAAAGPAAMSAAYLIGAAAGDDGLGWPPEIWGGLVAVSGFVGLGLVLIQESTVRVEPGR